MDIKWINNFGHNGYGICGRRYAKVLIKMGHNVKVSPQPYMLKADELFPWTQTELKEPSISVWHGIPTVPAQVYYTVTEVKQPPDYMVWYMKEAKMIMTQSRFCKESFSRITDPEKIHVVNFPFFRGQYSPVGPKPVLKMAKDYKFKFFTVARYDVRKNLKPMMKAFAEEFGDNDEVCLIMKLGSDRYCIPKIFYEMDLPKNVMWMSDFVDDMSSLYRAMDAYVTTDNGEGWGAPTTEAMLCGLPTIAPNHSGHLDYMNKHNSYLIDVGDWEYIGNRRDNLYQDLLCPQLEWKRPIYEDIKVKMRQCYEDFKDIPKTERLKTNMIKASLKVQEIVDGNFVAHQFNDALNWYKETYLE